MKRALLEKIKSQNKYVSDIAYLGKYQGYDAYLQLYKEDVEIGMPHLIYEKDNEIRYACCFDGGEARALYDKYVKEYKGEESVC